MSHIHLGRLFHLINFVVNTMYLSTNYISAWCPYRPVNNQDMVPQIFFNVFPMELKACSGKLLAAATVHFL